MTNSAKTQIKNLEKVLALNAKINSTLDLEKLLGVIMNTAAEVVNTHAASLMLLDPSGKHLVFKVALGCKANKLKESFQVAVGEGIAGTVAKTRKALIVNDTQKDKRFAKRFDASTGFTSEAILCVPMHVKGRIIGILEAINPKGRSKFDENDLALFQAFADQAAIAVDNARLHTEIMQQEKTKQELKIASEIQENFLPDLSGNNFQVGVAAKSIPARQVGGDFYDVIQLDEHRTGITIGDVSGKGVPAALYMVRAISEYRFLAQKCSCPAETMTLLNQILAKNSPFGMFVTMLYLVIDSRDRKIQFVSAGHHPVLRRNTDGAVEALDNAGGVPVGLVDGTAYEQGTFTCESGDSLFIYTDGVIECRNPSAEEYGIERLKKAVSARQNGPQQYADTVLADMKLFAKDAPAHDDTTLLAIHIP